jgi:template-activating factor I
MSSVTNATNKPDLEEPNSKRAKLEDNEVSSKGDEKRTSDKNNGELTEKSVGDNNNVKESKAEDSASGSGANEANNIPSKVSTNGNDKNDATLDDGQGSEDDHEPFEDPKIASKLGQVEDIQTQISKLNEQASEEILKVEQKFNKLRRPHFEKRNALLKDVPNFWLTTLANHPMIAQLIEHAEDEDCLHYMTNLDVEELEDIKSGYNLKFYFAENPYIKNDLIVRELRHLNSEEVVVGTTGIEYKDTPQGRKLKEIVENSIMQQRRKVRPEEMQPSFFAWLTQQGEPGSDEIAEIIKDQIWPSPLEFFFSTPDDYGDEEDDDDSDDDEEDYDDEEGIENEMPEMPDDDVIDEELEGEEFDDEDDDDDDVDDENGDDEE